MNAFEFIPGVKLVSTSHRSVYIADVEAYDMEKGIVKVNWAINIHYWPAHVQLMTGLCTTPRDDEFRVSKKSLAGTISAVANVFDVTNEVKKSYD